MPTSDPVPTAAIGCVLVKISASGPMPTSRYCDHRLPAISRSFTRCASGDPGVMRPRSRPTMATTESRSALAFAASPRACSSMTRSSMLATKVTPLAFSACRSHGARNQASLHVPGIVRGIGKDAFERPEPRGVCGGRDGFARIIQIEQLAGGWRDRRQVVDAVGLHPDQHRAANRRQPDPADQNRACVVGGQTRRRSESPLHGTRWPAM